MKDLIIVGAGGLGRELLEWVEDINKTEKKWNIKGFIADWYEPLDVSRCDCAVIGTIQDYQPSNNEEFTCAIGDPVGKEKVVTLLKSRGAVFTNIIHPTVVIGSNNTIGEGFVACPNSCITTNVTIGNFVTLLGSSIGHDVQVGDFTTISGYCDITGGVKIGKRVFVGSHVTIIPKRRIGDDAYLGAGSVVVTHVKEKTKVMGNPAKVFDF